MLSIFSVSVKVIIALGLPLTAGVVYAQQHPPAGAGRNLDSAEERSREPFKIFDNLYYVGINRVSTYLLTTSEGLILIDTSFAEYVDHVLSGVQKLGFDPADIRYALVTHAHPDHYGGAAKVQELTGAKIGAAAADWAIIEQRLGHNAPRRDLVLNDGQTIALGDTTIRFYVTPGHTAGVLSMEFEVFDAESSHKAFIFGGVGTQTLRSARNAEQYIHSVERIKNMPGIEVNIGNHPWVGTMFDRAIGLDRRTPEDPHPYVAPADFYAWLDGLLEEAGSIRERHLREAPP